MPGASYPLEPREPSAAKSSGPPLVLAGAAALLASTCCVVPLVFAIVGISGAWIGRLRVLEPYSSWLTGMAIAALAVAAWRLYRAPSKTALVCDADDAACRRSTATMRRWFWLVAVLTLVPLVVPLLAPLFY